MSDKKTKLEEIGKSLKSGFNITKNFLTEKTSATIAGITTFLAQNDLLKWTESLTKSSASIYDKALDKEYLKTHIGGGDHRMFDGGHDIFSAWQRAKDASTDDTFSQEVIGYITALWKDVTTSKGLPFETLDKANFEAWAKSISETIPGIKREWLVDLMSFDAMEVFASALGAGAVLFALTLEDEEKLAEILGSMGINSIISANPIMGICVTVLGAYAYWKEKKKIDGTAMTKGASLAIVSAAIFGVLGLPILIELGIVMVVGNLLRKHILDNKEVIELIKMNLKKTGISITELSSQMMEYVKTQMANAKKTSDDSSGSKAA